MTLYHIQIWLIGAGTGEYGSCRYRAAFPPCNGGGYPVSTALAMAARRSVPALAGLAIAVLVLAVLGQT